MVVSSAYVFNFCHNSHQMVEEYDAVYLVCIFYNISRYSHWKCFSFVWRESECVLSKKWKHPSMQNTTIALKGFLFRVGSKYVQSGWFFRTKHFWHLFTLMYKVVSLSCESECVLLVGPFWQNIFWQYSHWCGFSFLWIRMCTVNAPFSEKHIWQYSHWKGFLFRVSP